jgi:hypothetical protein
MVLELDLELLNILLLELVHSLFQVGISLQSVLMVQELVLVMAVLLGVLQSLISLF